MLSENLIKNTFRDLRTHRFDRAYYYIRLSLNPAVLKPPPTHRVDLAWGPLSQLFMIYLWQFLEK